MRMCVVLGVLVLTLVLSACTPVVPTPTPEPTPTATPEELKLQDIGDEAADVLYSIGEVTDWIAMQEACDDYVSTRFWALYDGLNQAVLKANLHLEAGGTSIAITLDHKEAGRLEEAIEEGERAIQGYNRALNNFWWVHDRMVTLCDIRGLDGSPNPTGWN